MPCITTTCDTGALTVLSKSFSTRDRQETVWLCAVSSCLTVAPRFLFFFAMKKKKYDDRHRRHKQRLRTTCGAKQNQPSRKRRHVEHQAVCSFCIWRPELCVLKLHVTVTACAPLPSISSLFCFCFCKKNCKHARARPKKKSKKKKEGSSTEVKKERPKHLQVLIQLGL